MRKICERLALFFIITQINRVANFIYKFQPRDDAFYLALSYCISIGLALGVYASFYFIQKKRWAVRLAALIGVFVFGSVDLFFNVFDVVVTVSQKALIPPSSSFAGITASQLQTAIQIAALAFGALPTVASATLGLLQGSVTMLTDTEMGATTIWTRLGKSLTKIFDSFAIRVAFGFEAIGSKLAVNDSQPSVIVTPGDNENTVVAGPKQWSDLSRDDVAYIQVAGRKAIQVKYHVSNGSAGNWKARIVKGDRPWQDAQILTENAGK